MSELDKQFNKTARERIVALEDLLQTDVILIFGPIAPYLVRPFRTFIENLRADENAKEQISIVLNTPGGSAETVEKLVEIVRYHYGEVWFIIPDEAMSAGTIFALSGDAIYMDYTSSLGPIDPQVHNGKEWVPALGYLDRVNQMIDKSQAGTLTDAELLVLQSLDLAMLSRCEQAKNLTITLLKKWLCEYKFKDWEVHESDHDKLNQPVNDEEKDQRAEQIAEILSNNQKWHSHGRKIGIKKLKEVIKLKIEDYSTNHNLRTKILSYSEFMLDFMIQQNLPYLLHSRCQ